MSDAEVVQGEVVDPAESVALAPVEQAEHVSAIEQAALTALADPGIPGRDEFLSLCMQAKMFSMSAIAPKALRGKPHDAFVVLMTGRALGIDPTAALRKVYVIDGQPSIAPQLSLALVRRQGLGAVVRHPENSETWAAAIPLGPNGQPLGPPVEFSWEDAQQAGLVRRDCLPHAHKRDCSCKANWKSYPARMLWWRAAGFCVDDYFPEVGLGLYAPDELGAVTDDEGRPIDPATVELPEGFEGARRGGQGGAQGDADEDADDETRAWLWAVVNGVADADKAKLREAWKNALGPTGPLAVSASEGRKAKALLRGMVPEADDVAAAFLAEIGALAAPIAPPAPPSLPDESPDAPEEPPSGAQSAEEPPDAHDPAGDPDDDEKPTEAPKIDRARVDEAKELLARLEPLGIDSEAVAEQADEVRAMHFTAVNTELRARGYDPDGVHIDIRRMVLTACYLEEIARPVGCKHYSCGADAVAASEWCATHRPSD